MSILTHCLITGHLLHCLQHLYFLAGLAAAAQNEGLPPTLVFLQEGLDDGEEGKLIVAVTF